MGEHTQMLHMLANLLMLSKRINRLKQKERMSFTKQSINNVDCF